MRVPPAQLPNQNSLQQADQAISEFERSNLLSFWPALNKAQIIGEMRSRIHDPFQVNQGGQPFCGPAAITNEKFQPSARSRSKKPR